MSKSVEENPLHPNSPVFRDYRQKDTSSLFRRNNESLKLWGSYFLIKEANEGNPMAQHELGLRYLTGKGFTPDTAKGFYWISLAASNDLPPAHFNLAILYNNGWGVEWNPFQAFRSFLKAAEGNMTEASYVVGLFYTDNLVVPRNMEKAYNYIRKAADKGYGPAKEVMAEFRRKGLVPIQFPAEGDPLFPVQQKSNKTEDLIAQPGDINYLGIADSTEKINEFALLKEVLRDAGDELRNAFGSRIQKDTAFKADESTLKLITMAAEEGSPEAILLLGKCYEKGIGVEKDIVKAAAHFIRAMRLASPKAARVLYSFLEKDKVLKGLLKKQVQKGQADAEFVWAMLSALGLDRQITGEDAFRLLQQSANKGYEPAIIELGLCYYTGNLVDMNKTVALNLWQKMAGGGNSEAAVRMAVIEVQEGFKSSSSPGDAIKLLKHASEHGSLLAQMALAKCYEEGRGVKQNKAEAIHYYRLAAQRGSPGAFRALKQMYNEVRPGDEQFIVIDEE